MAQSLEQFIKGRIKVPMPVDGDAYTVAGEILASPTMRDKCVYEAAARLSPKDAKDLSEFCYDDRIVLYGLTDFIREKLTTPITMQDIDDAEEFMQTTHAFGGPLPFDRKVWERVVNEYDGFLPIKIEALPEGSTFYANEIPIQVTSLDKGFGEIAALIEANLVGLVSNASTRATMERHLLERFKEYAREDNPQGTDEEILFTARIMMHDFGMRASSTSSESEVYGRAHLLTFPGTDTFNAAYQAWAMNGKKGVGGSILALAHRTVQGWDSEQAAFDNIREAAGPGGIASYVSDCYDFHDAVAKKLVPMALQASKTDKGILVARPDSGDYRENVRFIVEQARENGLYTEQPQNGRLAMTNLRFIQGDSMRWKKMTAVLDDLRDNGYSPVNCGIFGVGGWLRNTPDRDKLSWAYKLAAKGSDLEPVVKLSDTRAKLSVPGPVQVLRGIDAETPSVIMHYEQAPAGAFNALTVFYDGGQKDLAKKFTAANLEDFSVVQHRVLYDFDAAPKSRRVLSDEIVRIQDATMAAHDRSRSDYQY
jgi:nicotinamide phosphoribosyltransferase